MVVWGEGLGGGSGDGSSGAPSGGFGGSGEHLGYAGGGSGGGRDGCENPGGSLGVASPSSSVGWNGGEGGFGDGFDDRAACGTFWEAVAANLQAGEEMMDKLAGCDDKFELAPDGEDRRFLGVIL